MNEIIQDKLKINPNLINDITLYYKKYPLNMIEANISNLNIKSILITQDLTIDFIIKYILLDNELINESFYNIETIFYYQYHINKLDLINSFKNI